MPLRLTLTTLIAALLLPTLTSTGAAQQTNSPLKPNLSSKKLIEFGWDQVFGANPAYIRDNIREIEKRPFDGIVFCLPDPVAGFDTGGRVFHIQGWNEEKIKPSLDVLAGIKWEKYTDNFLALFAASTMDWFSDSDWETVTKHTKFMSLAAKTAKCKGVMFDAEPYGMSPWRYDQQSHAKTKSFDEYAIKVRERGRQFMQALSSEMPAIKILTLFQYSAFTGYPEYPGHEPSPNPQKRLQELHTHPYGLMAPFMDGMLEAAGPEVQFIDGNEFAYYYKNPMEFYRSYFLMKQTAKLYVAPELRGKYDQQVKAGQSLYLDFLYNLRPDIQVTSPTIGMTPQQRERWLEHNTYYGLQASDEYIWLYSEKWNWWNNAVKGVVPQAPELTDSAVRALTSAKAKIANSQPLGFDIADDIKAGDTARLARQTDKFIRREANIARLTKAQKPTIDGKLNEAIYSPTTSLDNFVTFYRAEDTPLPVKAQTKAWVHYDEENLYITTRNEEPLMQALKSVGTERDSQVWKGDSLDISLRLDPKTTVVHHFILNPMNVQWDSRDENGQLNLDYNPTWKSATRRGENEWTVEVAIPWTALKMTAPIKGTTLQANIGRQRMPEAELSSWSQFMAGFMEPDNFGTWKF